MQTPSDFTLEPLRLDDAQLSELKQLTGESYPADAKVLEAIGQLEILGGELLALSTSNPTFLRRVFEFAVLLHRIQGAHMSARLAAQRQMYLLQMSQIINDDAIAELNSNSLPGRGFRSPINHAHAFTLQTVREDMLLESWRKLRQTLSDLLTKAGINDTLNYGF